MSDGRLSKKELAVVTEIVGFLHENGFPPNSLRATVPVTQYLMSFLTKNLSSECKIASISI